MRCQYEAPDTATPEPCFSTATHKATIRMGQWLRIVKVCGDHALELRAAGVEPCPIDQDADPISPE